MCQTLSRRGGTKLLHSLYIQFDTSKKMSRASIICDLQVCRMRHKMELIHFKSYNFVLKGTTKIFINPAQCPSKSVKTENDITSSKLNTF